MKDMNRIDKTFKKLKKEKKKAFIPYVTAGDPDMKTSESIIEALAKSGADIIEVGIPFSADAIAAARPLPPPPIMTISLSSFSRLISSFIKIDNLPLN